MKVRSDFVTNSSSSSFVVLRSEIGEEKAQYILDRFEEVTREELYEKCYNCDLYDSVYYLVDYAPGDDEMHIWVRRDEAMDDDFIDDTLYDFDKCGEIEPKFEYHY